MISEYWTKRMKCFPFSSKFVTIKKNLLFTIMMFIRLKNYVRVKKIIKKLNQKYRCKSYSLRNGVKSYNTEIISMDIIKVPVSTMQEWLTSLLAICRDRMHFTSESLEFYWTFIIQKSIPPHKEHSSSVIQGISVQHEKNNIVTWSCTAIHFIFLKQTI